MDVKKLERQLKKTPYRCVKAFTSLPSTNDYAKQMPLGGVVIAAMQTRGRGRQGHDFFCYEGGLYFSFVTDAFSATPLMLTPAVAVAVCKAINSEYAIETDIKWVNDIYKGYKKVGGILVENLNDRFVVGIGLNLAPKTFIGELRDKADCLFYKNTPPSEGLIAAILKNLTAYAEGEEFMREYKHRSLLLGNEIEFEQNGKTFVGTVTDVNDEANLLVDTDCGEMTLQSGEVKITKF